MTAHDGYVWFLPSWYAQEWWNVDFLNGPPSPSDPRPQEAVPCSTEVIIFIFVYLKRSQSVWADLNNN